MSMQKVAQKATSPVWWALPSGASMNRWLISAAEVTLFPGEARPHPDQVDYHFINGWVATGDLPCREAFRKLLPDLLPESPAADAFTELYLGGENPRVDFTTFCFQPTRMVRFARALLHSPEPQSVTFEAETCGVMHVWIDGKQVLVHQPLDRNIPHKARFMLALPAGESEVIVRLEDLHERDTSCFFRLGLLEGQGLAAGLRVDVDDARLKDVERTLAGLRTTHLFHEGGRLAVTCDHTPDRPVEIRLGSGNLADSGATMNVLLDRLTLPEGPMTFTIAKAGDVHELFDVSGIHPGCYGLEFSVDVGDARLSCVLGTTIMTEVERIEAPDLAARKAEARRRIAQDPGSSISRGLLLLGEGGSTDEIEEILRHTMVAINGRYDCADFWILPLIWAWREHSGAVLGPEMWGQVREAILNFRYWLDEPGNDVMWFWSENHAFCFHVAQFLAGDSFAKEIFPNSGKTGEQHRAQAQARLHRWFDSVDAHGLAEWNSSCYYPIDLLGLFTLEHCSPDAELAKRARGLIDKIFVMTALHSVDGMPVGSQGRVYERELFAGPATELGAVAAIAFGGTWCPGHERAAALFALSDYEPPHYIDALHDLDGHRMLEARYTQGLNENAKLALWKSAQTQLSSVTGHRTGDPGHQQHVSEIQFAGHQLARSWVSHPGELKVWGGGRPSYWMANGVVPRVCQQHNVAALVYDLERHDHPVHFTHVFAPAELLDECIADGHWLFLRLGDGYAAIWNSEPLSPVTSGLYAGQEWRSMAKRSGWLLVAGSAVTHGSFEHFRQAARDLAPHFEADALRLVWQQDSHERAADFAEGLYTDGAPTPFAPLSTIPHAAFDGAQLKPVEI